MGLSQDKLGKRCVCETEEERDGKNGIENGVNGEIICENNGQEIG